MSPTVEKSQFRNNDGGYVGAVVLNARGDEHGIAVAPGETVWLSEAEQILTANAPRRPEDNPFIEQKRTRMDPQTGEVEEFTVTPLVVIEENRYIPANERPIPADFEDVVMSAHAEVAARGDEPIIDVPDDTTAVDRSEEIVLADQMGEDLDPPPRARAAAEEVAAQQPPEHTQETGAAVKPSEEPPEGEYAQHEEVGTPDAPAQPKPFVPDQG